MAVVRSTKTTYMQRLIDASEDMENAKRGIREFSHSMAVTKLLDCYFSIVRFDLEFKNQYAVDRNEVAPIQLMALHVMLVKKQLDIDNTLMLVNRNTIESHMSVLKRLFTQNRAFGEVVSILNKVTDLSLSCKAAEGGTEIESKLPPGLSRFDMSVAGSFDTIIGQNRAIETIRKMVDETVAVSQPLSVILYGPPGTGKTSLALAVGREYKMNVYTIAVASLGGQYVGEREKNTMDIFKYLEDREEDILLFIDEADSFLTASDASEKQQTQYTRAVTTELFEKFLAPRKQNNSATIKSHGVAKKSKTRLLVMATNFETRIAEDIRRRSAMIFIDLPRTESDMLRVVDFYRNTYRINMSTERMHRIVRYVLKLNLAPSHVSQIMRRIATQVLLDMLRRGIVFRKSMDFPKRSGPNPLNSLVVPVYTVGGTAVNNRPGLRDVVVSIYNENQMKHKKQNRVIPLSGVESRLHGLPRTAVYPCYDGKVERFFRSFVNFDQLMTDIGDDSSVKDPEYVVPDGDGFCRNDKDSCLREVEPHRDQQPERSAESLRVPPISLSTEEYRYASPEISSNVGRARLDGKTKRAERLKRSTSERNTLYPHASEIKTMRKES